MLYVCSFTFGFCNWHRHIITANLINIIIATIDKVFHIPVTDIELLSSYYVIAGIFILLAARSHVKETKRNDERKDQITLLRGLLEEAIDNLLVAQVKKYPEVLGGVEIGNGKVRMNIPVINKVIEFDTDDIKTLKETLIAK